MAWTGNAAIARRSIQDSDDVDDLCETANIEDIAIDELSSGSNLPPLSRVNSYSEDRYDAHFSADIAGTTPTQSDYSPSRFTTAKMTATSPSPQRSAVSPSSSPRLPSPPPFTEVQIGPKSPTVGDSPETQLGEAAKQDDGSTRRIRPGTKAADMASGPPLIPLADLESPFQLQEHLKALYHTHTRGPNDTTTPITRQTALTLSTPPTGIDKPLWLYELCRFLTMKANNLIIAFFADTPACSATTCAEMRASEWQYLCAVHDPPKSCCAIDYCCHTLDWAANILTSPKYFPSRLTLGGDMGGGGGGGSQASMRHLTNIFRRVYRIFAHAWFQHRGVFWQVEGHEGLYVFFKTVCDVYQLIPEDNYTIPSEAEGGDGDTMETPVEKKGPEMGRMSLLKKTGENGQSHSEENGEGEATTTVSVGATTRRHKHTPSTGSHVTTIAEGPEEEEPSSNETDGKTLGEQAEPPRGRPMPPGEDTIANSLGKLSLGDLNSTTNKDGPAEQPTPQPQNVEKNPFEEVGKLERPAGETEAAVEGAAPDLGEAEEEEKKDVAQQNFEYVDLSEHSTSVQGSGAEPTALVEGKDKEQESGENQIVGADEDNKAEKVEGETKAA